MRVWPGDPAPLGATFDGLGTNIAVFSNVADAIEICVFDGDGNVECVELPERSGAVFHGYFPDMESGARYGLRVHGPYDPGAGHRCDPSKLLIDPYARAIDGDIDWDPAVFAYDFADPAQRNQDDSAAFVPKSVVVNPYFDWAARHRAAPPVGRHGDLRGPRQGGHDDPPGRARGPARHVRGHRRPGVRRPPHLARRHRAGAAAGAPLRPRAAPARPWAAATTGATTPSATSRPHHAYSSRGTHGQQVHEFKQMVKTLHTAGIEVILDVVYNHTAEGNEKGPTLSMRGIDNASYYRLVADDPQYYMDYTGTGNTLNMRDAYVLQLVMDSLRYWATEMHVDGFRFDLASALGPQPARGRPAERVLRSRPAGSGGQPAEADRRAVGHRRGRLPGGQLPGAVGRVERPLPRLHPRSLGRQLARPRRVRLPHHRLQRPVRGSRSAPARQHQLRHRPRRLHPARSRLVQREAQRGQRRGRPRRRVAQPQLELRRRGTDRRPGDQRAAVAPAAQPAVDAAAVAGRADDPRRRRARPHPAGQQQRLLPGQRDLLVRLVRRRRRSARVHPPAGPLPPRAQGVPPSPVLPRARACTATRSATSSGTTPAARR